MKCFFNKVADSTETIIRKDGGDVLEIITCEEKSSAPLWPTNPDYL